MRGSDSHNPKTDHVSVRLDAQTAAYLDSLSHLLVDGDGESMNRSETIRVVVKSHSGLLFGNFLGVVDADKLSEHWGGVGHVLASSLRSDLGPPPQLDNARLADIIEPLPVLISAADAELSGGDDDGRD